MNCGVGIVIGDARKQGWGIVHAVDVIRIQTGTEQIVYVILDNGYLWDKTKEIRNVAVDYELRHEVNSIKIIIGCPYVTGKDNCLHITIINTSIIKN